MVATFHFQTDHLLAPLLEHVGAALEEQHAEDVYLELGGVHLAAQDVGGLEQVALQLGQGQGHGVAQLRGRPAMISPATNIRRPSARPIFRRSADCLGRSR